MSFPTESETIELLHLVIIVISEFNHMKNLSLEWLEEPDTDWE